MWVMKDEALVDTWPLQNQGSVISHTEQDSVFSEEKLALKEKNESDQDI